MDKWKIKIISIISLILIVLSSVPYIYGWVTAPADTVFLGNGFFNPHDNHVYYAYIKQVINGRYFLQDIFTSEPHRPFLNIFWLAVGLLAKILRLGPIAVFHLARIILIPIFVLTSVNFISFFFKDREKQKEKILLASVLLFFTSGIGGWLMLLIKNNWLPWEVWWPEAYAFFSAYASPHFLASWLLIITSLHCFLQGVQENNYKLLAGGGVLGLILTQFHSFYLALLIPLTLIMMLLRVPKNKKIIKQSIFYNSFFIPVIIYYFLIIKNDWVMQNRLFESKMYTPDSPWAIIFVFGLIIPLAIPALVNHFKQKKDDIFHQLVIIWFITTPFLLYSSLPFERRLIEGWQMPAVLLATETIYVFKSKWLKEKIIYLLAVFILFILPTLLVFLLEFTVYLNPDNRQIYLPQNLNQALIWLRQNKNYDEIVLAAPATSIAATFLADKKIYAGHKFETIKIEDKINNLLWLIGNNNQDEAKKKFLKANEITYLVWGPYEQKLQPAFNPAEKKYLDQIYKNEDVEIYKIKPN